MATPPSGPGGPHILGYDPPPVGVPPELMETASDDQKAKLRAIQVAYARKAAALHHDHLIQALDVFDPPSPTQKAPS